MIGIAAIAIREYVGVVASASAHNIIYGASVKNIIADATILYCTHME